MTVYIYVLVDPRDNRVRYVGKSINPKARLQNHLSKNSGNELKDAWLHELKSLGLKPEMKIIDKCKSYDWQSHEIYWIKEYRRKEKDLTNLSDGGISGFSSISTPKRECYACRAGSRKTENICRYCDGNRHKIVFTKRDKEIINLLVQEYGGIKVSIDSV